jgi:Arc/MetJ-type ribon-helix-helix transcriptional regulator
MSKMITVRVSDERGKRLDALVKGGSYRSRAAAVNAALDLLLAEEERRAVDEAIVDGYTRLPPTPDEDAYARASTIESVSDEAW